MGAGGSDQYVNLFASEPVVLAPIADRNESLATL